MIPVTKEGETHVIEAKSNNQVDKENLKTIDNQSFSSKNGEGVYHQKEEADKTVEAPEMEQNVKPGVPILNTAFPRPIEAHDNV
jgi:CRISPR/Cas system-associated endonuclease Cas1